MKDFEYYLEIANHDIQIANNQNELKSYIASLLCDYDKLQQENQQLKEQIKDIDFWNKEYNEEFYKNKLLKKQVIDVINILQIGIDTYNNDGGRSALLSVICEAKKLLEILEDKEV